MTVKILKCEHTYGYNRDYYQYTVRVYTDIIAGTHKICIPKSEVLEGNAETIIQKELESMWAAEIRRQWENDKAQSIVGKIFHW